MRIKPFCERKVKSRKFLKMGTTKTALKMPMMEPRRAERRGLIGLEIEKMRAKSMAKVTMADMVISSERLKSLTELIIERTSIVIDTVIPIGTEYWKMFLVKRFLTREVFFSRARMTPGKPMQAKFRSDISRGANGYSMGMMTNRTARMAA